jgi:hypothetical protein
MDIDQSFFYYEKVATDRFDFAESLVIGRVHGLVDKVRPAGRIFGHQKYSSWKLFNDNNTQSVAATTGKYRQSRSSHSIAYESKEH